MRQRYPSYEGALCPSECQHQSPRSQLSPSRGCGFHSPQRQLLDAIIHVYITPSSLDRGVEDRSESQTLDQRRWLIRLISLQPENQKSSCEEYTIRTRQYRYISTCTPFKTDSRSLYIRITYIPNLKRSVSYQKSSILHIGI